MKFCFATFIDISYLPLEALWVAELAAAAHARGITIGGTAVLSRLDTLLIFNQMSEQRLR